MDITDDVDKDMVDDTSSQDTRKDGGNKDEPDIISPLPSSLRLHTKSTHLTHQDDIRLMNSLNGVIERNWIISEDQASSSSQRKASTSPVPLKRTMHKLPSDILQTTVHRHSNRLARRFSESPVRSIASFNRRQIMSTQPRSIAFHRVREMFEEEINPRRGETLGERAVTAFIKHESISRSLENIGATKVADDTDGMELTSQGEKEFDIDETVILTPSAFPVPRKRSSSFSVGMQVGDIIVREGDQLVKSPDIHIPKAKRKLSDQAMDSRILDSRSNKRTFIRPGTPSPRSRSPSSPWRSTMTPEKLKRLKRNIGAADQIQLDSSMDYSTSPFTRYRKGSVSAGARTGTSTPRIASISSDLAQYNDSDASFDMDSERDTASQVSTFDYQSIHYWRQTDDDDEWEYQERDST